MKVLIGILSDHIKYNLSSYNWSFMILLDDSITAQHIDDTRSSNSKNIVMSSPLNAD